MYCPNCAQSNNSEQRFCRKCGLNLESISHSLSRQLNDGAVEPADRRLELFGNIVFGGLGVVGLAAVVGLIYTIITGFILSGRGVAFGIIVSLLIVFGVLAIAWVILNEGRKDNAKKQSRANFRPQPEVGSADTAKLLQTGKFEPTPSVVENTTELLHVEAASRKD
jgi:hypothetical protein